jgi:PRTRC genetic system protein F
VTFATTLTLPHLGAARAHFAVNPGDAIAAGAVLALYKAGRFDPGRLHPARVFPGALALVRTAFEVWLRSIERQFEHARFSMDVGVGVGSAISDTIGESTTDPRSILEIVLGNKRDDPLGTTWILKRRYEAIERAAPGLARTALAVIGLASRHGLPVWTPAFSLDAAQWAYWGGCEDEREWLEQMVAEGENPDDIEMLRRADFDRAIPPEVSLPREVLKPGQLERLARGRKDTARIAGLCLEIRSACRRGDDKAFQDFVPERVHEVTHLHHVAGVRWSDDDPSFRIYDDWANPAYENGEALEAYGWYEVPIEPPALKAWFAGMERKFHITTLGQQLLPLIAEEE